MSTMDRIEDRLRVLDLRFGDAGPHLTDERVAELVHGDDPDADEACHLAACDICTEILVALGEGLEALACEEPELSALVFPEGTSTPEVARRSRRRAAWPIAVGGMLVAAVAAAAVGYAIRGELGSQTPSSAPPVLTPKAPIDTVAPPDENPSVPPAAPAAPAAPSPEAVTPPVALAESQAAAVTPPAAAAPAASPVEREAEAPAPPKARGEKRRPTPTALPRTRGSLARPAGPTQFTRTEVDGPLRGWGYLRLTSKPSARVFVDGKARGWTPVVDLRLLEGPHDVRLEFESPLAREREQRFRVMIEPEKVWSTIRRNLK